MLYIDAESVRSLTPWPELISRLEGAFRSHCHMPARLRYEIGAEGSLLAMPAWIENGSMGVKLVQVFPGNSKLGKPAVHGLYMLASAVTGEVQAAIDADELTTRRTAATSALASKFLSREDSRCLLLVGAGRLAADVAAAHAQVRPIERILVWARRPDAAAARALEIAALLEIQVEAIGSLPEGVAQADIVSTITTSSEPLLLGREVRAGTHLDLIGAFTPRMRETDDQAIRMSRIFVDMRSAALREAGDIVDPIARGVITEADINADLFDLCAGGAARQSSDEVTLFKSVGLALEDLAAASLAWDLKRAAD
ncbi:MAG TPA: ornithine cyclodeaminase family protein [Steroidobacteraceae bacterium]|jgi:ornithine cyclodeaminase